jgi:hypothetical protein
MTKQFRRGVSFSSYSSRKSTVEERDNSHWCRDVSPKPLPKIMALLRVKVYFISTKIIDAGNFLLMRSSNDMMLEHILMGIKDLRPIKLQFTN